MSEPKAGRAAQPAASPRAPNAREIDAILHDQTREALRVANRRVVELLLAVEQAAAELKRLRDETPDAGEG